MLAPIWHHHKVHQECPWRTCGVLTWLLMSDLDETFTDTLDRCSLQYDTISRSIRNVHVLLYSRKRLEDSWSFDMVPDVRSWWNFHRQLWWMFPPIWHHFLFHQKCPCPPETWRTGGVLTWFLMSFLDETFTDTSYGCPLQSDTFSRSIRNVHLLLDFWKRLGKQEKSWNGFWCKILMRLPINKTKHLLKPLV